MPQAAVKKKVSMIPAKPQYDRSIKLSEKKLRVAAYCRVSTELEEQESSYEAQVEYYTRKIEETDNWKMAGIYADDGKSAKPALPVFIAGRKPKRKNHKRSKAA